MKLVFVAYLRTHIVSMLPQAEWLQGQGFEICYYLASKKAMKPADEELLTLRGIPFCRYDGSTPDGKQSPLWATRRDPVGYSYRRLDSCWRQMRRVRGFYTQLLARWKPDLLILPEENIGYLTNVLVILAHEAGAKALVVPYTLDNPLEAAEAYHQSRHFIVNSWLRRLFAHRYPAWSRQHKGVQLLRLPFWAALMTERFHFTPPDPWQTTCSFSDAVAVESNELGRQHLGTGVDPAKLNVTGSIVLDQIAAIQHDAQRLKAALLNELGLDPTKPIFLAAIPPDQFNTQLIDCEFQNHAQVVTFWLDTLAATGWNVVVNLHPHLKPEQMDFSSHPRVKYCARPTAEVIPLCDVFVACISATIRWAIAAGKPVINHDLYRYHYGDYHIAPGVIHVEKKADFVAEISRIIQPERLREVQATQATVATDWGLLDGKGGQRLLTLMQRTVRGS